VLKSVHRPLALKSLLMLRDPHLLSGIQCLPLVTVSSSLGASAFHQVTSLVLFLLIIRSTTWCQRSMSPKVCPCSLDDQSEVAEYHFGHKRNIFLLHGEGGGE
jgi:hypothetical protein